MEIQRKENKMSEPEKDAEFSAEKFLQGLRGLRDGLNTVVISFETLYSMCGDPKKELEPAGAQDEFNIRNKEVEAAFDLSSDDLDLDLDLDLDFGPEEENTKTATAVQDTPGTGSGQTKNERTISPDEVRSLMSSAARLTGTRVKEIQEYIEKFKDNLN